LRPGLATRLGQIKKLAKAKRKLDVHRPLSLCPADVAAVLDVAVAAGDVAAAAAVAVVVDLCGLYFFVVCV